MGAGECFLKQILRVNNRIQLNDKFKGGKGFSEEKGYEITTEIQLICLERD